MCCDVFGTLGKIVAVSDAGYTELTFSVFECTLGHL